MFLGCVLVRMRSNYPDLTRRRTSRLGSNAVIARPFQHGSNQSFVMERAVLSEAHRRPSVLVVGGSDGSGTRAVVELMGRLGVPMLVDDTGTYDVHALVLGEGDAEQGWPPLVRSVLEITRSANYELHELPPNALHRFRDQLTTLRTSYESRADELLQRISTNRQTRPAIIQYGFKAPVSMLLLPLLLDVFGSIKFLHVVRDGRDVAVSDNQSPVNKFYESFYPEEQREKIDGAYWADKPDLKSAEKYIKAMRLWNDWNEQAGAWSQSHVDDDAFDYHLIRSEDLISDPQRRVETIQQLAVFVGSPRSSPGELCCLTHHLEFDFGTSTSSSTSVTSQAQQRMPPWKRRAMMPFADPQTLEDRGTEVSTEFLASNLESLYDSWKDATKSADREEKTAALGQAQAILAEMQRRKGRMAPSTVNGTLATARGEADNRAKERQVSVSEGNPRKRYGKWRHVLKDRPDVLEKLQAIGAPGLRLFGYEPCRDIYQDFPLRAGTNTVVCNTQDIACGTGRVTRN
jgi:Sulfotransferase domain